jgi:hypothetical protein
MRWKIKMENGMELYRTGIGSYGMEETIAQKIKLWWAAPISIHSKNSVYFLC